MKTIVRAGLGTALLTATALLSCQQNIQPREDSVAAANAKEQLQYVKLNEKDDKPSFALGTAAPILLTGRNKQESWEAAKKMAHLEYRFKENLSPEQVNLLEKEYLANFEAGSSQVQTAQLFFAVRTLDRYWLQQPASNAKTEKVSQYAKLFREHQYGDPMVVVRMLAYLKDQMEPQPWKEMASEFLLRGRAIAAERDATVKQIKETHPSDSPMAQALDSKQLQYVEMRKQQLAALENMLAKAR